MRARIATWIFGAGVVVLGGADAAAGDRSEWEALLKDAAFELPEAVKKGLSEAGDGVPFHAELEKDKGAAVYSIDVAQGTKTCNVVLDAKTGRVVEKDVEEEDHSAAVKASKTSLLAAIEAARRARPGRVLEARLVLAEGKPVVAVRILGEGDSAEVRIDAVTGAAIAGEPPKPAPKEAAFTDVFRVEEGELGPTGTNPWFVLEPGHVLVLGGKEDGEDVRLTITVTKETRKIAGVETRLVEEREEKGGELVEVSRNFFAVSKRTNDVYYFGEEVDIYEGGKVVRHEGAWLAGEKGARFGLMMPGTPLLGARYFQEIAPGVAMDRAEIADLDATIETPSGTLAHGLVTEETSALEKGKGHKGYAPGIGLVWDGDLRLVKCTPAK